MTGPNSGVGTVKAEMPTMSSTASAACWAPDDRAAEPEDRPIGHDHADLRQQIDAEQAAAGRIEGELRQPEGERRPEIGAELEFMPDRQHDREIAGRRGNKTRRERASTAGPAAPAAIQTASAGRARSNSTKMET